MAKKTTKRRAWTKENVRTLKVFAQKKKRAASIAETLKRTEGAIRQKACSLGLSLDTRCRKFASPRPASDKNFCLYCGRRDGDGRQFLAIKAEQIFQNPYARGIAWLQIPGSIYLTRLPCHSRQ